jgi:hypothetical protein
MKAVYSTLRIGSPEAIRIHGRKNGGVWSVRVISPLEVGFESHPPASNS